MNRSTQLIIHDRLFWYKRLSLIVPTGLIPNWLGDSLRHYYLIVKEEVQGVVYQKTPKGITYQFPKSNKGPAAPPVLSWADYISAGPFKFYARGGDGAIYSTEKDKGFIKENPLVIDQLGLPQSETVQIGARPGIEWRSFGEC